jgi:hypothetical protein
MEQIKYYVLFPSHTEGMKLCSILSKNDIRHTIVPTPRELSVSCGISIMFDPEDSATVERLVEENGVKILGIKSLRFGKKSFYL